MTTVVNKLSRVFDTLGLTWFPPIVKLIGGQEPAKQVRTIAWQVGLPAVGIAAFLLLWSLVAPAIQTPIGAIPTPGEVWNAGTQLVDEYRTERIKEREFYASQAERRITWEKRWPGTPFKATQYSGKPTYLDQIITSLKTVFFGFLIASAIAIPLGILCGMSRSIFAALSPFVQILKPVSPLAWLPLVTLCVGAAMTSQNPALPKSFVISAIVVALCSLWPTLINTALGVASIDKDYLNVARVLQLGPWKRVTKIIIPSSLPLIFTGLRLSLGVGWMVLIAAEMLAQNPGLGKFVWDMFQNGSSTTLSMIMFAVFTIGIIGFALDRMMVALQRLVSYDMALAN